ncbi:hypothetical protein TSAR_007818 [Trichomalopsis sarcophagae]|uniref:Peptidase M13 C-terminal domain-containing protein n=1 Tax=Trichomalopsis sarcophagae TaxID=543379 RepID=A0A232FIN9_9HYME|nr:hypothetical protein TSAR_007818 [Trichomalopsis sarcophagae]
MFVRNFDKNVKNEVSELVSDLKSRTRATIQNVSNSINQLCKVYDSIIHVTNISRYSYLRWIKQLEKQLWKSLIDDRYISLSSYKLLPAGILRGHFFQSDLPKYAQCMIQKYNYTVEEVGEKVTFGKDYFLKYKFTMGLGDESITENITDNDGIKSVNMLTSNDNVKEPCLPNLDYTPQQTFWISAANVWCTKVKDDVLRRMVQDGVHSPNIVRVSVTFSNMEEFARDFQCKTGSKMDPENRCSVL